MVKVAGAKYRTPVPVMHLFPRKTSRSECGVYGIMTNRIEDVTCPDCVTKYHEREAAGAEILGDNRINYAIGLASSV